MQITVTDHNDWEKESFSFILEVSENTSYLIKSQESFQMKVDLNTNFTELEVNIINKSSNNGYMDRIGFYEILPQKVLQVIDSLYENIFYKGNGLVKIK